MEFTLSFLGVFLDDVLYASPILGFMLLLILLVGYLIDRLEGWSAFDAFYHAWDMVTSARPGERLQDQAGPTGRP